MAITTVVVVEEERTVNNSSQGSSGSGSINNVHFVMLLNSISIKSVS